MQTAGSHNLDVASGSEQDLYVEDRNFHGLYEKLGGENVSTGELTVRIWHFVNGTFSLPRNPHNNKNSHDLQKNYVMVVRELSLLHFQGNIATWILNFFWKEMRFHA